jgi:predicted RecB family endonuclease
VNSNNYTLDRFEADYAIFLKRPNETEQLIIHRDDIHVPVGQGDIVSISDDGENYEIKVLAGETKAAAERIKQLMKQLRQRQQ